MRDLRISPWILVDGHQAKCEYCGHDLVGKPTREMHEPECPWLLAFLSGGDPAPEGMYTQLVNYREGYQSARQRLLQE